MQTDFRFLKNERTSRSEASEILKSFFDKHFEEFLKGKRIIMISNELSNNSTIFNLEFNFDKFECEEPNSELMRIYNTLIEVFGDDSFNIEITPKGARLISNFIYGKLNTMQKTKETLAPLLDRMKNLDLQASFTSMPIPRIGVDPDNGFLYCPSDESSEKFRNSMFGQKPDFLDEEYWKDYIINNLIPVRNRMSMNILFKKLDQVNTILGGGILSQEELKEKEE